MMQQQQQQQQEQEKQEQEHEQRFGKPDHSDQVSGLSGLLAILWGCSGLRLELRSALTAVTAQA